jgi:hypothetical protein
MEAGLDALDIATVELEKLCEILTDLHVVEEPMLVILLNCDN